MLTGTATTALGLGAEHGHQSASLHAGIGSTGLAAVGTHLANRLGTDGSWYTGARVGQVTHSTSWALDVGSLGIVGHTLVSLHNVLALGSHHDDAALLIHKLGWGFGDGWATTRHLVLLNHKKLALPLESTVPASDVGCL